MASKSRTDEKRLHSAADVATARLVADYRRAMASITTLLHGVAVSGFKETAALVAGAKVRAVVAGLRKKTELWARQAVKTAYLERQRRDRVSLAVLGRRPRRPHESGRRHARRVDEFVAATVGDFSKALGTVQRSADLYLYMVRRGAKATAQLQAWDEEDLADVEATFDAWMKDAIVAGWSRKRVSDMMERYLANMADEGGLINIKGRNYTLEYYAEMVARTRLRQAQSEATKVMCDEYETDLVEFSTHSQPCEECAELQGQVFSISGNDPDYPPLTDDVTPPIHPNCEHSISPTSREGIEFGEHYSQAYEEERG